MTDPRIPAALTGGPRPTKDPLHWCVFATVSLLTWAIGPLALAGFALAGVVAYGRAFAGGRRRSRCLLGDTRLVLGYLAAIFLVAAVATVRGW
ncbi:MAG TPA: hypothetical protein VF244_11245 [Acidimicrobiales bacterium]